MIVVDTNILAYLLLPTEQTAQAERLLLSRPGWAAPLLWRSELRNVLALYLRKRMLTLEQALVIQAEAEALLADAEYEVPSLDVLRLAAGSDCSAYDCEFVALAQRLNTRLVTADRQLLRTFPDIVMTLEQALI